MTGSEIERAEWWEDEHVLYCCVKVPGYVGLGVLLLVILGPTLLYPPVQSLLLKRRPNGTLVYERLATEEEEPWEVDAAGIPFPPSIEPIKAEMRKFANREVFLYMWCGSLVCCYVMWACAYLAQCNPIIQP